MSDPEFPDDAKPPDDPRLRTDWVDPRPVPRPGPEPPGFWTCGTIALAALGLLFGTCVLGLAKM